MPHIYNEQKVPNSPYWKNYLVVGPLMLLVVTPRLILISIFFACCRHWVSVDLLMIALVVYGIPFWKYSYAKFKSYGRETWKMILINFAASIVGPCIAINPTSSLVVYSCLFSMFGYLALLGSLLVSCLLWPSMFILPMAEMIYFVKLFIVLIPTIIFTSLCSFSQLEEEKQILALQSGLGSICCEENNLLTWALERRYEKLTQLILDSWNEDRISKFNFDFVEAGQLQVIFRSFCAKGWSNALEKIMKHQDKGDFILSKDNSEKTGFIHAYLNKREDIVEALLNLPNNEEMLNVSFQGSCKMGHYGVVELLLNQANFEGIISSKDKQGENGFMKACQIGQHEVVVLLLKHPNIAEIINEKDKTGSTGYMKACRMPSIEVMTLIHEHTTDPIEREDVFKVFKSLCKSYATEAKKHDYENDKIFKSLIKIKELSYEMTKWQNVLQFILTKNDFRKMRTSTLGPKVTDHPSEKNVSVISQTIDKEKTLVIHMDTSNEVPTFKFNP